MQLVFKNFSNFFSDAIYLDHCLISGEKKALFKSKELNFTEDCDKRNWIDSIEMIDVEYLPVDDEVFTKDFSGQANIHFGSDTTEPFFTSKQYLPECLGRQKSSAWEDEKESRILCCLYVQDFKDWSFIDLRLKEEIFRDMSIIMNPWADPSFEQEIRNIIVNSPISNPIKSSITIQHSCEEGKIQI